MSFPNPVDVAKIAALLRKNEGWYETIDEAYELLVKSDEYCKAQQSKKLDKEKEESEE
ncbi:MAG: hypothetical protein VYC05_04995 [Verrucomicrobiota bacterium]|jgi:hypothetical protein|nr:hypothetical protein [Verrucomicrobiota bacterium]|tara:strand:- start:23 stop:196 length:174 start_codon:yes stop_codon:yes gene_type:complete